MGPRAAQTPLLEELHVKTCPLGSNGALDTLWREMLHALIRWQNDPLGRPSQLSVPVNAATASVAELRKAENAPFCASHEKFPTVVFKGYQKLKFPYANSSVKVPISYFSLPEPS